MKKLKILLIPLLFISFALKSESKVWKRTFQSVRIDKSRVERLLNAKLFYHNTTVKDILALSDEKIRELLQPIPPLYYCRCPNCGSHLIQYSDIWVLSGWSIKEPFKIQCVRCKMWFPNEKYKNNAVLEVVTPTGKKLKIPYYRKPNGDAFFYTLVARQILNETLCEGAQVLAELWLITKDRKYAHKAIVIMDRFCEIWYDIPVHANTGNDLFHIEIYTRPPYLGAQCSKLGRWKGDVIPFNLVKAYDMLYECDEFERMSRQRGYDVRLKIEKCFKDAVHMAVTEMEPIPDQILRTAYCLGDPQMMHLGVRLFYKDLRKRYCLDGMEPLGPGYHSPCGGYINVLTDIVKGYSDPKGYVDLIDGKHYENLDLKGINRKFCEYLSKKSSVVKAIFSYPDGYRVPVHDAWSTSTAGCRKLEESKSYLFPGFGHAILGRGKGKNQIQAHLHFSVLGNHSHNDMLNIILWAKGHEFLPDFGYTHTLLRAWSACTLGHNTVVIDQKDQYYRTDNHNFGNLLLYDAQNPTVKVVEAEGIRAYDRVIPDIKEYKRLIALVAISPEDSYVVDVFWVKGGKQHDWVIHTGRGRKGNEPQKIEVFLRMKKRKGTLLGKDKKFEDVKLWLDEVRENRDSEYGLIDNLKVASTDKTFQAESKFENDPDSALRLTMLGGVKSEIILGDAPNSRAANADPNPPKAIFESKTQILIVRRKGPENTFIAIWEPYSKNPFIKEVSRLRINSDDKDAVGIKVSLVDGREDYILIGSKVDSVVKAGNIKLVGKFGWIRKKKGKVSEMYLLAGKQLSAGSIKITSEVPNGVIRDVKSYAAGDEEKCLIVKFHQKPKNLDNLKGKIILVIHPDNSTHGYKIEKVEKFEGRIGNIITDKEEKKEDLYKIYTDEDPGFRIKYRNVTVNEPTLPMPITEMLYFPLRKIEWGENTFIILVPNSKKIS